MNLHKKAIQSHILILVSISFILTILVMTVFAPVFTVDHERCKDIEYVIKSKSKMDGGVLLKIENKGNVATYFQFNNKQNLAEELKPKGSYDYRVLTQDKKLEVMPLYVDYRKEVYKCRGKKISISLNTIN